MRGPFTNEPVLDFQRREHRSRIEEALSRIRSTAGGEHAMVVGGDRVTAPEGFVSVNPSRTDEVLGRFQSAPEGIARKAVDDAHRAFGSWRHVRAERRAEALFAVAELLRQRRYEADAWLALEVGKPLDEADAEVAEAIDLLEFYGREVLRYGKLQPLTPYDGEANESFYVPIGVTAVLGPWNFPLAVPTGAIAAAVGTGNTVVWKPSSQAPLVGTWLADLFREAGVPDGVLNLVTGPGERVGEALVRHPETRLVVFNGSREVGLRLSTLAAEVVPGQRVIRRASLEMTGKDVIIVDRDADVASAISGVVAAAFGYQGQKRSSCGWAVVDEVVYDEVVAGVADRARTLRVGNPEDPDTFVGPLICEPSYRTVVAAIEAGRSEGRLAAGGEWSDDPGWFVRPTVFADVAADARLLAEPVFGPVLSMVRVKDFDEALAVGNASDFGLTGSVYSRDREKLDRAAREFEVGTLYLNRKCTGGLVGVHPLGGGAMSGTTLKVGGREYLRFFLGSRIVSRRLG